MALSTIGALALAQSTFAQAQSYYLQALDIHQELEQFQYVVEDWAGLALVALRQADLESAQMYANQVLEAWTNNPSSVGSELSIRTFYSTWRVCQGLALDQENDVLAAAVNVMQLYLDNQDDPETRAIYLKQPYHLLLWEAWEKS